MFNSSHASAAAKLNKHLSASAAAIDQLQAAARDAGRRLHDCEYLALKREHQQLQYELSRERRRLDTERDLLEREVRRLCPAASLIEQLRQQGLAAVSRLQNDWFDADPASHHSSETELDRIRQRAARRDSQIHAWTHICQQLPQIYSSPTPFSDVADLLNQHADVLSELKHISVEIPAAEEQFSR
ncbi:MAG: hypothetical protein KF861_07065 [Planctomycetaceae bacterium]|nr:hypothetical protein [Planctomycetaceae bacterium]